MRFHVRVLVMLLACTHVTGIHHNLQQVLDAQEQAEADSSVSWNSFFPSTIVHNHRYANNGAAPELWAAALGAYAGTAGTVTYGDWYLMQSNFVTDTGKCSPISKTNLYRVHHKCAQTGTPAGHGGIYSWGSASPVQDSTTKAWRCPAVDSGSIVPLYIGRSKDDMRGRCKNYHPDTAAFTIDPSTEQKSATPGDHQFANFQLHLNKCECLYYRYYDYTTSILPYVVCESVDPRGSAHVAPAHGRVSRSTAPFVPERFWILQIGDEPYIMNEEDRLIRAAGGYGNGAAKWNRANGSGGHPLVATCPAGSRSS